VGLFDKPVDDNASAEPQQDCKDSSFDLSQVLLDFYGPDGSKAELLVNVASPNFNAADVLDVYDDFVPIWEDVFRS